MTENLISIDRYYTESSFLENWLSTLQFESYCKASLKPFIAQYSNRKDHSFKC